MKLPCTIDLFSMHSDSDESSNKREDSAKRRVNYGIDRFDLKSLLDQCCQQRAGEFGKKHWEEEVRVRRKLILTRRRHMILFADGKVILLRRGHIRTEYQIDDSTDIKLMKGGERF